MSKLLLWSLLFFLCWPLALAVLLRYPVVWLVSLPLRLLGKTVGAAVDLLLGILLLPIRLPARMLRAI
jgi:hypothetical protein